LRGCATHPAQNQGLRRKLKHLKGHRVGVDRRPRCESTDFPPILKIVWICPTLC
jgi:hypothetical protein